MKQRIKFNIKPFRNDMCGARIEFYVVDIQHPHRYQHFMTMLSLKEFYDMQGFEDELYRNSKWVLKRLTELCIMLERWWESSDILYMLNAEYGIETYPKPIAYRIESEVDGNKKAF